MTKENRAGLVQHNGEAYLTMNGYTILHADRSTGHISTTILMHMDPKGESCTLWRWGLENLIHLSTQPNLEDSYLLFSGIEVESQVRILPSTAICWNLDRIIQNSTKDGRRLQWVDAPTYQRYLTHGEPNDDQ